MEQAVARVESELDLTTRVELRRDDEIGKMGAALNRLLERLQGNLQSVARAAAQVAPVGRNDVVTRRGKSPRLRKRKAPPPRKWRPAWKS